MSLIVAPSVDARSFDRQLLGAQWGPSAAQYAPAQSHKIIHARTSSLKVGTRSIHRVNGIGIRNSNTIYAV